MGDKGYTYRLLVGKAATDHFEDLGVDGRIILKCIFGNNPLFP